MNQTELATTVLSTLSNNIGTVTLTLTIIILATVYQLCFASRRRAVVHHKSEIPSLPHVASTKNKKDELAAREEAVVHQRSATPPPPVASTETIETEKDELAAREEAVVPQRSTTPPPPPVTSTETIETEKDELDAREEMLVPQRSTTPPPLLPFSLPHVASTNNEAEKDDFASSEREIVHKENKSRPLPSPPAISTKNKKDELDARKRVVAQKKSVTPQPATSNNNNKDDSTFGKRIVMHTNRVTPQPLFLPSLLHVASTKNEKNELDAKEGMASHKKSETLPPPPVISTETIETEKDVQDPIDAFKKKHKDIINEFNLMEEQAIIIPHSARHDGHHRTIDIKKKFNQAISKGDLYTAEQLLGHMKITLKGSQNAGKPLQSVIGKPAKLPIGKR